MCHSAPVTLSTPFTQLSRLVERGQSTDYGPTHADRPVGPRHRGAVRVRGLLEGLAEPQRATSSSSGPAVSTRVVSVSATSQLSEMVKWDMTNKTGQAQLVTCEVLVLNGSTQLGDYGAEEFSEVSTLAGSSAGDTAQIVCQKD